MLDYGAVIGLPIAGTIAVTADGSVTLVEDPSLETPAASYPVLP